MMSVQNQLSHPVLLHLHKRIAQISGGTMHIGGGLCYQIITCCKSMLYLILVYRARLPLTAHDLLLHYKHMCMKGREGLAVVNEALTNQIAV